MKAGGRGEWEKEHHKSKKMFVLLLLMGTSSKPLSACSVMSFIRYVLDNQAAVEQKKISICTADSILSNVK